MPVFLEAVDAPLAFRMLNGADLSQWDVGASDVEFDKLTERIAELIGQTGAATSRPSKDWMTNASRDRPKRGGGTWTPYQRLLG